MIGKIEILKAAEQLSDWDVIQRILSGEKVLLELLYDRFSGQIYHKCLSIVKDQNESKDLTHDVMIKTFLNLDKFKGDSSFSLWLNRITYNYCLDHLKKKKRLKFDEFDAIAYEHISIDEIELENKVLKEIQLEQLEILFKELNGDDKMVLLMRYQDGFSIKKIATTLGMGESAIKMRLKRSRDRLAALLKSNEK